MRISVSTPGHRPGKAANDWLMIKKGRYEIHTREPADQIIENADFGSARWWIRRRGANRIELGKDRLA
jgi:hypothetical protein